MSAFQGTAGKLSEVQTGGPCPPSRIPVLENHFSAEILLAGVEEVHYAAGAYQRVFMFGLWVMPSS